MPAIAKTSDEAVVKAARKLLEKRGAAALTMQAVADAVGVRAPSLYKRFPDRDALLDATAEHSAAELRDLIAAADEAPSAKAALTEMARAYRAFARKKPQSYGLLFADRSAAAGPTVAVRAAAVAPVLARLAPLVGDKKVLHAARLLTAWLHGFVSMELAGAFKLGGDLDEAFEYGLKTLLDAVAAT